MEKNKDNPVPSLDKIKLIEEFLNLNPHVFKNNTMKMLCFMGIKAILQNGVETNNGQPKIDISPSSEDDIDYMS